MLSNTAGYSRFSRSLGSRRDDLSALGTVCPAWRTTGKCKAYNRELALRHAIATAKEEELQKKATALYNAQMDLVADLGSVEGDVELLESMTSQAAGFSTDPSKREEMIRKLTAELKQEPAYLNWSLDAAVAERMVELRLKPCRYSHRGELTTSLKRSRNAQEREEGQLAGAQQRETQALLTARTADVEMEVPEEEAEVKPTMSSTTSPLLTRSSAMKDTTATSATAAARAQAVRWEAERHRIFQTLTPVQRCVVCLLWQRRYAVAQGVVCDVRLTLERSLTAQFERTGRVVVNGVVVAAQPPAADAARNEEEEKGDPLEDYLRSADFEGLVEQESARVVPRVTFRPEFGVVDLSALPLLIAHLSATPGCGVLLARTLTFFTGKALPPRPEKNGNTNDGETDGDDRPAPTSFHHLLFPTRKPITEKEVDLGGAARADEVVEALEWTLQVYEREAQLHARHDVGRRTNDREDSQHVSALFRHQRVRLHGLTLRHCKLTSADAVVAALRKRNLGLFLYALDLADNRLWSLRFLLVLRARFAERLLRLSLRGNPITRKPEYQEQVRLSLPQLTSLDGEPIRRPPLRLPKPLPSSYTRCFDAVGSAASSAAAGGGATSTLTEEPEARQQQLLEERQAAQATVLDCVGRLLYIFETRRIPHTARELRAFEADAAGATPFAVNREEEEWNEDNFPHRYLHPAAAFSVALAPGLNFFDPATMRDARSVEHDADYTGMRLSAVDARDARVFDVAMKNSSRNLLAGRPALQRFGRGAENCYLAYQLTLYPERMAVLHHVSDAVVAVSCVTDADVRAAAAATAETEKEMTRRNHHRTDETSGKTSRKSANVKPGQPERQKSGFGALARGPAPTQFVVTLHGLMTWQLPSMKAGDCMRAAYTRVLILTKKVLPAQNRAWERLRSPPYVLMNDALFLYPAPSPLSVTVAPSAIFRANTPTRLSRLVVEFGLEACRDGIALVRDVMERCTSAAAESAALQALVLGAVEPRPSATTSTTTVVEEGNATLAGTLAAEDAAAAQLARAAAAQLTPVLTAYVRTAPATSSSLLHTTGPSRSFVVFSVLEGGTPAEESGASSAFDSPAATSASTTSSHEQQQQQHQQQQQQRSKKKAKKEGKASTKRGEDDSAVAQEDAASQQPQQRQHVGANAIQAWAAGPHVVTRSLVHAVTSITNACYTCL